MGEKQGGKGPGPSERGQYYAAQWGMCATVRVATAAAADNAMAAAGRARKPEGQSPLITSRTALPRSVASFAPFAFVIRIIRTPERVFPLPPTATAPPDTPDTDRPAAHAADVDADAT